MSYRYKDSQTQPSSLPRRYFSLPKNYSPHNSTSSKDSSLSSRYRTTSSSSPSGSTTPSTQTVRHGSLQTYSATTTSSLNDDLNRPSSRRSGMSSLSSSSGRRTSNSSVPRKNSYPFSQSSTLRDLTPSYTTQHVSSVLQRGSSLSHDSSWPPGELPVRQRSSISLRKTQPVWEPNGPPVRQHSSGSLHDSPFILPSRRTYSSTKGSSDAEVKVTSRRKTSPVETKPVSRSISPPTTIHYARCNETEKGDTPSDKKTTGTPAAVMSTRSTSPATVYYDSYNERESDNMPSHRKTSPADSIPTRSVSPPTVQYQGSESRVEKPASSKPAVVQYSGSVPRNDSSSSRSEASTSSNLRRGSSGSAGGSSDNDEPCVEELESSAARDISLLSREIASVYEGSLSRSDSRKGRSLLKKQNSGREKEEKPAKEKASVDKEVSNVMKMQMEEDLLQEKSPLREKGGLSLKGHKRSSSTGSASTKDEPKKPGRKFSGVFSRKKSQSTDSEGEEERSQRRSVLPRKGSKDSVSSTRRGSSSSSRSVSPAPKRKISSPSKFFSYSSDSKTTPELPKKFSVPGKFFTSKDSKDSKSGNESSDLENETGRSRSSLKRRVSLPGMFGLTRSSSADRAPNTYQNPEPLIDPVLLKRRRSNFKRTQSVDVQNDPSKNSMLSKLKFWDHSKKDKSPDSRASASPEEGRSRSLSPKELSACQNSEKSTEEELKDNLPQSKRSRERVMKMTPQQEADSSATTKPGKKNLKVSPKVTHSAKVDDAMKTNGKEAKVLYVGPVDTPSPAEQPARKQVQHNVNSENKSTDISAEVRTDSKGAGTSVNKVEDNSNDGSMRDTVSTLRERRRRRREERERFFASLEPTSKETSKTEVVTQKDNKQLEEARMKQSKSDTGDANQDKVDRKMTSGNNDIKGGNEKVEEPTPKPSVIRKGSTVGEVSKKGGRLKSGKPRYQTIASSVHADIIADLIREKGLKSTTTNEVKIPSVAELRAKFLISKDDGKVSPPRLILKLDERPNSVCGGVLSPTEMKKFDDITFSLARKGSSDDIKAKKFSDRSTDSMTKLDTEGETIPKKNEISTAVSAAVKNTSLKEKKEKNILKEESKVTDEQDVTIENDTLKKRRGSKTKKRKKSIFGTDKDKDKEKEKEPKTPDEDVDMPQHGAVSAAIKAMFTRRPSLMEKNKMQRKQRLKSAPDSSMHSEVIKIVTDRERKKSAPEEIRQESPDAFQVQPVKVDRKENKDQENVEKMEEVRNVDNEKDVIELQPMSEIEEKPKERKSLKKPSKNKKRTFKSSLKPFSMMKTKSESNLAQRFDFVAVDIPLDVEPATETKNELVISNESEELIKQEETTNLDQRGRRPSVFEDSLKEFYDKTSVEEKRDLPSREITLEDLDAISGQTTQQLKSLAGDKMKIRPKRHHKSAANPVKSLQQRNDVRTDTEVEKPRIEKKQVTSEHPVIRRKKKKYKDPENLWRRHTVDLAASALAGLASTEDFTKIRLRKTAGPDEKDEFRGTKPIMLIHIKGRRHLQVRLVEPNVKSLNSGDCFALVTEKDLFSWIGKDCNPYEKAKVTEIVSKIKAKSELDCKARDIVTIEDGDLDYGAALGKFFGILKADPGSNKIRDAQSMPKDEEYEKGCVKGNMVYKVHWTDPPTLMPVESMCGHIPQVSILDTKEVFIFDFGSELYVWTGQQSLSGQRKSAFALAKQLYEEPFKAHGIYDPIFPYGKSENGIIEVDNKISSQRPSWTLFARLHEKAETILFREKFLDWPDPTKIIRMKGHPSMLELAAQEKLPPVELKPCDPKSMLKSAPPLECPSFEGVNVGRGKGVPTVWVGDIYKEGNLVTTVGLTVWHINEYRHFELPAAHHGHFHSGEGYVIRWAYFVLADRVAKDRKSRCRSTVAGRVRCAYFFWQGNDCSVNEKGAAAIMAVELDEEKGPQVRVVQGKENPVFLNLFKGGMIIHNGSVPKCWYDPEKKNPVDEKTATFSDTSTTRLYVIRNEEPEEACLNQVKASSYSLRSRSSFVLVVRKEARVFLWHGCKSSVDSRLTAKAAAEKIQERKGIECNLAGLSGVSLSEIEEGDEPEEFWKAIGGKKYYCSLAHDPSKHNYQPRLFELTSATGKFKATEVLCPSRSEPKLCPFPFIQEDLYTANQPALFIVDGYYDVYVWEGWMLEDDDDVRTGSGRQRWDRDRRLAMETALSYAKEAGKRVSHRVYVVYAGMEPMTFKALFPYWNDTPDVIRIQKQDGKQPNVRQSASDLLQQFTKEFYTLAELQKVPPPQGVDPAKLEAYLSDSNFQEIFKMDKEAFNKLPGWKQVNLKKAVGLF